MKKALLTIAVVLMSVGAQARSPRLYVFDMTGDGFTDQGYNLMDDGIPGHFEAFGLKLEGKIGDDFEVEARPSNPGDTCEFKLVRKSARQTLLQIDPSVETDSGDTCDYTITYRDGRHATVKFESQGT